ncbi:MAG: hypothetical protein ACK5JP_06090 [Akkermansiaceae bacterium]|jgi:hypothetical protein
MKINLINKCAAVMLITLSSVMISSAELYAVGAKVEAFKAKDQHDADYEFKPSSIKYLLVSHDMETGKKANAVLTTLGKDYFSDHKAAYLANIEGMPRIGRMFAIPKMQKYAHRIILGDDAGLIAKFPMQAGKVTVIAISGGKVQSISYWSPGESKLDDFLK